MSLKLPLEVEASGADDTSLVGVIEKDKRHLFKRFMNEIDIEQQETNSENGNVNGGYNFSEEEQWQISEDNPPSISSTNNDEDEEGKPKNYEDFETLEERVSQWNVFKRTPRADLNEASRMFLNRILQVCKLIIYLITMPAMLVLLVLSHGLLLIAVSNILPHHQADNTTDLACFNSLTSPSKSQCVTIPKGRPFRWATKTNLPCLQFSDKNPLYNGKLCIVVHNLWAWCTLLMIVTPYFFIFLKSLWRILFQKKNSPTLKTVAVVLCFETLHSIGMCMLMFLVLPSLDNVFQMSFIVLALSIVPSWLKIFFRSQEETKKYTKLTFDILAAIVQLIFLVVCPMMLAIKNSQDHLLVWSIPCSVLLVSLRWWENYADRFKSTNPFKKIIVKINTSRTKLQLIANIWKIGVTLIFMPTCMMLQHDKIAHSKDNSFIKGFSSVFDMDYKRCLSNDGHIISFDQVPSMKTDWMWIWLLHTLVSLLAYFIARTSAKILMQQLCYALPLALSSIVMLSLALAGCETWNANPCAFYTNKIPSYLSFKCYNADSLFGVWIEQLWYFMPVLWLSQLWTTWHIWAPNSEKLAPADRLFVYPLYDGVILQQSLLHNRRRRDQPKKAKQRVTSEGICHHAYIGGEKKTPTDFISRKINEKDKIPFIYICATMWHETRTEMISMLKSVFKLDLDQFTRKEAKSCFGIIDRNFYEFEAHIFFDDAFTTDISLGTHQVNSYVKELISVVDTAASYVHGIILSIDPPTKYFTPYGGRLIYQLPGNNRLIVHLKDSAKVRHKKRWSQVMYMYYFLSHNLWLNKVNWRRKETRAANIFLMALDGDVDFEPQAMLLLVDLLKRNENVGAACGRIHPTGTGPLVWYQKFEYALGHWLQKATEHVIGCVLCAPGCFSLFRGLALMEENVMATYTTQSTEPGHYIQYDQGEDRWLCTLILQQGYSVVYCAASDAFTCAPENLYEFFRQRRRWMLSTIANIVDLLSSWRHTTQKNESISMPFLIYQGALLVVSLVGPGTIFLMIIGAVNVVFGDRLGIGWSATLNIVPIVLFIIVCFTAPDIYQLHLASLLTGFYCIVQMIVLVGIVVQMASNPITFPSTLFFFFVSGTFILSAVLHPQEFSCLLHGFIYYLSIPTMYLLLSLYAFINMHVVSWGTREDKIVPSVVKQEKDLEALKQLEEEEQIVNKQNVSGIFQNIRTRLLGGERQKKEGGFNFNCGDCLNISCCLKEKEKDGYDDVQLELIRIKYKLNTLHDKLDTSAGTSNKKNYDDLQNSDTTGNVIETTQTKLTNNSYLTVNNDLPADTNTPTITYIPSCSSNHPNTNFYNSKSAQTESITFRSNFSCSTEEVIPEWMKDQESLGEGPIDHLTRTEFIFFEDLIKTYLFPLKKDKKSEEDLGLKLKDLRNKISCSFLMVNATFVTVVLSLQMNVDSVYIPWFSGDNAKVEPIGFVFMCVYGVVIVIQLMGMIKHRVGTFLHVIASTRLDWFGRCGCNEELEDREKKQQEETEGVLKVFRNMSKVRRDDASSRFSISTSGSVAINDDECERGKKKHNRTFNRIRKNAKYSQAVTTINLEEVFHRNFEHIQDNLHKNNNFNERETAFWTSKLEQIDEHDKRKNDGPLEEIEQSPEHISRYVRF